jgi:hypothetical protein
VPAWHTQSFWLWLMKFNVSIIFNWSCYSCLLPLLPLHISRVCVTRSLPNLALSRLVLAISTRTKMEKEYIYNTHIKRASIKVPASSHGTLGTTKKVCLYIVVYIMCFAFMISDAKSGASRESQYGSFATCLARKIRDDTNIVFRIIAIIFGVSHLSGFSNSSYIRFFLTACLLWSLVLTGAFTVSKENCLLLIYCQSLPLLASLSPWRIEHHLISNLSHTSLPLICTKREWGWNISNTRTHT